MGRTHGPNICIQPFLTTAIGDVDATTKFDIVVPGDDALLREVQVTTKTAGVGAGTFSIQIMTGAADAANVAVGSASGAAFVTAAAVAGTVHGGFNPGIPAVRTVGGQHLAVKTVKTGTVSTGAVLLIVLKWTL